MSEQEPRYVVTDRGEYAPPNGLRWFVYDYRTGGCACTADGPFAEFSSRAKAYAWQREHQEPLEPEDGVA